MHTEGSSDYIFKGLTYTYIFIKFHGHGQKFQEITNFYVGHGMKDEVIFTVNFQLLIGMEVAQTSSH